MDLYRFLWTTKDNPEGVKPPKHRLKTMTLRGFVSQGLLLPLDSVLDAHDISPETVTTEEGFDLTELLGVTKWDPPLPVGAHIIGNWNFTCPKTDEERLQSNLALLDEMIATNQPLVMTRKEDGTSVTIGIDNDGNFSVCSRNYAMDWRDKNSAYYQIVEKYSLLELFDGVAHDYILQGELCGPSIQKNPLGLETNEWHIFNIWDKKNHCYLSYVEMLGLLRSYIPPLQLVPVIGTALHRHAYCVEGDLEQYLEYDRLSLELFLEIAQSQTYPNTNRPIEGIVVRPLTHSVQSAILGSQLSFKVISNSYLLETEDDDE